MSESPRWFSSQGTLVLAVLVAAACATPVTDSEDEGTIVAGTPLGSGGDTAGTPAMGTGGSLDAMMGTGGTLPMGGVMNMGSGGTGKGGSGAGAVGKGGTGTGGKAGSGTGGGNGGSSAGMITMPAAGRGGSTTGSGGDAGGNATGGAGMGSGGKSGGSGGMSTGGRGSGGVTSGGRSSSGGASAGGSAGSGSGEACPNPRDPAEPGAMQGNSGGFGTKAAVCYFVEGTFNAWNCSNLEDRMVTVNGKAGACGAALPPKVDGGYYFAFTASATTDYTSFFWYTQ